MDTGLVVDTFVELADTLAQDQATGECLHTLVDRCVETFDVKAAGVFLVSDGRLQLAAASDTDMEELQEYENMHKEGPCMDAFRTGEPVVAADLETESRRWPKFAPEAVSCGYGAGYAFPLKLRTDVVGALNMYREGAGELEELEQRVAQGYADVAAIAILQERQAYAADSLADHLQRALDSRLIIEQAKGILIERHQLTPQAAFEALRRHARSTRSPLHAVCGAVVAGAVPAADLVPH
jgi:GAF domain-containing protein